MSAVALFLTGGPLTHSEYTFGELVGTTNGLAVLAMIVLWVVLVSLVEMAGGRVDDAVDDTGSQAGFAISRRTGTLFNGAAVSAILLLFVSGYLVVG